MEFAPGVVSVHTKSNTPLPDNYIACYKSPYIQKLSDINDILDKGLTICKITFDKLDESIIKKALQLLRIGELEALLFSKINKIPSIISNFVCLTELSLFDIMENDFNMLKNCNFPELLHITIFSGAIDPFQFLAECNFPKICSFHIGCDIKDISAIKKWNFPNLERLEITHTKVTDIYPIFIAVNSNLPNLDNIELSYNKKLMDCLPILLIDKLFNACIYGSPLIEEFYKLPYKKYLPKKRLLDKKLAGRMNIIEIRNMINQYIDLTYTAELIRQVKQKKMIIWKL